MKVEKITFDVMTMVMLGIALWLGITGRVDWWVVVLFYLSQIHLPISFPVGRQR